MGRPFNGLKASTFLESVDELYELYRRSNLAFDDFVMEWFDELLVICPRASYREETCIRAKA